MYNNYKYVYVDIMLYYYSYMIYYVHADRGFCMSLSKEIIVEMLLVRKLQHILFIIYMYMYMQLDNFHMNS